MKKRTARLSACLLALLPVLLLALPCAAAEPDGTELPAFAEMTGLSAFTRQVTEENPIVRVSYREGGSVCSPAYCTDDPDEIRALLEAVLAMEIGSVSDVFVTDWDPLLCMTCADGRSWTLAFNGHWLTKGGVNYNLMHDEAFWKLIDGLRRTAGSGE